MFFKCNDGLQYGQPWQMVMVIFSQSWSSLKDDPIILTMVDLEQTIWMKDDPINLTMVDLEQTIWTWFDLGGACFSNAMMVCSMVNHGKWSWSYLVSHGLH